MLQRGGCKEQTWGARIQMPPRPLWSAVTLPGWMAAAVWHHFYFYVKATLVAAPPPVSSRRQSHGGESKCSRHWKEVSPPACAQQANTEGEAALLGLTFSLKESSCSEARAASTEMDAPLPDAAEVREPKSPVRAIKTLILPCVWGGQILSRKEMLIPWS